MREIERLTMNETTVNRFGTVLFYGAIAASLIASLFLAANYTLAPGLATLILPICAISAVFAWLLRRQWGSSTVNAWLLLPYLISLALSLGMLAAALLLIGWMGAHFLVRTSAPETLPNAIYLFVWAVCASLFGKAYANALFFVIGISGRSRGQPSRE